MWERTPGEGPRRHAARAPMAEPSGSLLPSLAEPRADRSRHAEEPQRYAPVITGHTVLTRAVTNVLSQAGLSCYQGVTSVCALWTTRLGISGEMAPPRGEDARREPWLLFDT